MVQAFTENGEPQESQAAEQESQHFAKKTLEIDVAHELSLQLGPLDRKLDAVLRHLLDLLTAHGSSNRSPQSGAHTWMRPVPTHFKTGASGSVWLAPAGFHSNINHRDPQIQKQPVDDCSEIELMMPRMDSDKRGRHSELSDHSQGTCQRVDPDKRGRRSVLSEYSQCTRQRRTVTTIPPDTDTEDFAVSAFPVIEPSESSSQEGQRNDRKWDSPEAPKDTRLSRSGTQGTQHSQGISVNPTGSLSRWSMNPQASMKSLLSMDIDALLRKDARFGRLRRNRPVCFDVTWQFLTDWESSRAANIVWVGWTPFLLCTVVITMILPLLPTSAVGDAVVETAIETVFILEFLVRLTVCPSFKSFMRDPFNTLDFLAALPLMLRIAVGFVVSENDIDQSGESWVFTRSILLGAVPVLRLLKCMRRFETFHLVLTAFAGAAEALPVLMYILCVILLTGSAVIYCVEPRSNIESLPRALWFTLVTMTTVGFGDVTPTTTPGYIIVSLLMVVSILYMSIPLGIVGSAFNNVWENRDRLLLMKRTRNRLVQMGYEAADIPRLFALVGTNRLDNTSDDVSALVFNEFRRLMKELRINMQEDLGTRWGHHMGRASKLVPLHGERALSFATGRYILCHREDSHPDEIQFCFLQTRID